ncbi:ribosome biogenesis protein BMS1 homolog isoform X2 [Syngnathus typhle]|uniref:ribosome biogenesis protein BMS1 homolog isoform X2 n=1 Tax=Syngnathus typhle TaxID=161592 RepID=UPI002A6A98F2|nr:ribosome biogenesis protein BMS1 homolog isoform X2 [Syngnathus typhle]
MDGNVKEKRKHQQKHSGPKAERKKLRKQGDSTEKDERKRNPKAFAVQSAVRMAKTFHRAQDIKTKKHHIPLVDRTPLEPPPVVIVVVGPPKVGKSTLIRCLIKIFTRQKLGDICGPVTIVSGKKRRLTFMECNNDINTMIDLAKVADLVLMLIDASFGFEMETFEFLNICQVHGFPRIMGVLTHLDSFKNNKAQRKTKKTLKHRFWTEVYQGAKLFYLSGMVYGEYQTQEVKNLGRFISVMKFRPLVWQTSHPYLLVDRMEDLTDPETIRTDSKCDRRVSLYGYLRGTYLKNKTQVHIPGVGDFEVADVNFLPDPCPLPDAQKKRALNEKERLLYAPMAGVGGVVYDKDAVYIDLPACHVLQDQEVMRPSTELVQSLIDTHATLDAKMAASKVTLFSGSATLDSADVNAQSRENEGLAEERVWDPMSHRERRKVIFNEEDDKGDSSDDDDDDDDDDEDDSDAEEQNEAHENLKSSSDQDGPTIKKRKLETNKDVAEGAAELPVFADSDDDLEMSGGEEEAGGAGDSGHCSEEDDDEVGSRDDEDDVDEEEDESQITMEKTASESQEETQEEIGALRWKDCLQQKASETFLRHQEAMPNLRKLVYGSVAEAKEEDDDDEELAGLFRVNRAQKSRRLQANGLDCSHFNPDSSRNWDLEEMLNSIRDCFVTGKWEEDQDAATRLKEHDEEYGDFEDLETGEVHKGAQDKAENSESDDGDNNEETPMKEGKDEVQKNKRLDKKRRLKERFDAEYDDGDATYFDDLKEEMQKQAELNRAEFEDLDDESRVQYEGFRPGMYVRLEISSLPCEFIANFDPHYPIIVGGLGSNEGSAGYLQMRLKKHRWYKRILKTRDPLILSLGWRRFQTMPLYHIEDHNGRHRLLKYTPQHMHCGASIWGPITPQGTGFLALQSVTGINANFRIAATGVILDLDKSVTVVKKLKLIGYPYKIFKNTCFIKGMFNTVLEVAKFEGASIRTVSGLRGQIKKAMSTPAGSFRATFEDRVLMSDIVFLRSWCKVSVPQLYNPITSLLLPVAQKDSWAGMRTLGQLKHDLGIRNKPNQDSLYKPVVRTKAHYNPLHIPKALQKALPYKSKPKLMQGKGKTPRDLQRPAVIREPHERKVAALLHALGTVHQYDTKKAHAVKHAKHKEFLQHKDKEEEAKLKRQKEARKKLYRAMGQKDQKKLKSSLKGASSSQDF